MNDSVVSILKVLGSVFEHLTRSIPSLPGLTNDELIGAIKPYADIIGGHLVSISKQEREGFREARGVQGQTSRMRQMEAAIHEKRPDFNPTGLEEHMKALKQRTSEKAKEIVDEIEMIMQEEIVKALKERFGVENDAWWYEGVPQPIRIKIAERREEEKGKGDLEAYFDLLDYKRIILTHWGSLFADTFCHGKTGSKEARTAWIDEVNETRKIVAHASKLATVPIRLEEVEKLERYLGFLRERIRRDNDISTSTETNVPPSIG